MPAPWEKSPSEKWKDNFKNRIGAAASNAQDDGAASDYVAGVIRAAARDGNSVTEEGVLESTAYQSWTEAVSNFSEEALKQSVVVADPTNDIDDFDQAPTGAELDTALDSSLDHFATKFADNYAEHYGG